MADKHPDGKGKPAKETIEQKLDRIAEYLHNLDRRDRIRTAWLVFRNTVSMIPILLLLGGAIYLYVKGDELFEQFSKEFAHQIQLYLGQPQLLKQLEQFLR